LLQRLTVEQLIQKLGYDLRNTLHISETSAITCDNFDSLYSQPQVPIDEPVVTKQSAYMCGPRDEQVSTTINSSQSSVQHNETIESDDINKIADFSSSYSAQNMIDEDYTLDTWKDWHENNKEPAKESVSLDQRPPKQNKILEKKSKENNKPSLVNDKESCSTTGGHETNKQHTMLVDVRERNLQYNWIPLADNAGYLLPSHTQQNWVELSDSMGYMLISDAEPAPYLAIKECIEERLMDNTNDITASGDMLVSDAEPVPCLAIKEDAEETSMDNILDTTSGSISQQAMSAKPIEIADELERNSTTSAILDFENIDGEGTALLTEDNTEEVPLISNTYVSDSDASNDEDIDIVTDVQQLKVLFPQISDEIIHSVVEECYGDCSWAIEHLLSSPLMLQEPDLMNRHAAEIVKAGHISKLQQSPPPKQVIRVDRKLILLPPDYQELS
jgi:hypothetical protein